MDFVYVAVVAVILGIILLSSLRYLSLLRWFSGQAYVLSKRQECFTVHEVLELFKNAKPFPVSYQKGWKIHSFIHGHRVWFHFLTFTRAPTALSSAPCIRVFATFDRIRASTQSLLSLIKDTSLSCEWRPGVIAARSINKVLPSELNGQGKGLPVLSDCMRVERVQSAKYHWPWRYSDSSSIVTPTVIEDYKRCWHREDNGCSWLLQMNEKAQSLVFFLIQPVDDPDHSLLTVVTWSAVHARPIIPADEAPSVLLSSLSDFIHLRRVQMTPLLQISLPHQMSLDLASSAGSCLDRQSSNNVSWQQGSFISRFRQLVQSSPNNGSSRDSTSKPLVSDTIRKSSSILHYRSSVTGGLLNRSGLVTDRPQDIPEEENESDLDSDDQEPAVAAGQDAVARSSAEREWKRQEIKRSVSEGGGHHSSSPEPDHCSSDREASEKACARYRTMINQAAADIMGEALRATNIDLETSASVQAEASGGWTYRSFENNVVVLKKIPTQGSTVQSYIGKGFIFAPPKTVWDAIRNPRTRFTYDDTLKKVDIVEQVAQGIKIVYLYQEVQQMLRKECCDICCLQGERVEGSKHVLAYTSVEHPKVPIVSNVLRGKMLSSGWIVEPVQKEKKLYSLVTYVMQVDYGPNKTGLESLPLEDMMSRQPLSIAYLQQYLKPAVLLARTKSAPVIPL